MSDNSDVVLFFASVIVIGVMLVVGFMERNYMCGKIIFFFATQYFPKS